MKYKNIIWDWNGTILNDAPVAFEVGLLIDKLIEPVPTSKMLKENPDYKDLLHKPDFLLIKQRKVLREYEN